MKCSFPASLPRLNCCETSAVAALARSASVHSCASSVYESRVRRTSSSSRDWAACACSVRASRAWRPRGETAWHRSTRRLRALLRSSLKAGCTACESVCLMGRHGAKEGSQTCGQVGILAAFQGGLGDHWRYGSGYDAAELLDLGLVSGFLADAVAATQARESR